MGYLERVCLHRVFLMYPVIHTAQIISLFFSGMLGIMIEID